MVKFFKYAKNAKTTFDRFTLCGPKIYNSYWNKIFFDLFDKEKNIDTAIYKFNKLQLEKAINGNLPKYLSIIKKVILLPVSKLLVFLAKNRYKYLN